MNFSSRRWEQLIALALGLAILGVYWPVVHEGFVNYDDNLNVTGNQHVQQGLTVDSVEWAFTTTTVDYWRPLTWLTHMLDWQLYGPNAGGHHLTNVLLHIANTLLLFAVWKRMTGMIWPSALVAGLFALHPLHVGSVAWVTERKDVLSGLFWMLALLAYARYAERRCLGRYLCVLLCFALGLMAKAMVMTLPFVLLLLDYWPLKRMEKEDGRLSSLVLEKVPFLLLAVGSTVVTFANVHGAGQLTDLREWSLGSRLAHVLVAYVWYLDKAVWPVNLSVYYPLAQGLATSTVLAAGLALVAVSAAAFRDRHQRPNLLVGWLWFLGTLVPVIGLVQGRSREAIADRYTYLPLIGIFIMVAWSIPWRVGEHRGRTIAAAAAAVVVLGACAVVSRVQVGYWKNSITLFEHALAVTSGNYVAHNNLGMALRMNGNLDQAALHFQEAVNIWPQFPEANKNLADILLRFDHVDDAVRHYRQALQTRPSWAEAHSNLGVALARQGQTEEAYQQFERAVELDPTLAIAQGDLALALMKSGRLDDAMAHASRAVDLNPKDPQAQYLLGLLLKQQGRREEAVGHFEEALRQSPNYVEARVELDKLRQ